MREQRWLQAIAGFAAALLPVAAAAQGTPGARAAGSPSLQTVGPQAGFGDLLVVGVGARFELTAAAPAGHVPTIDGQPVEMAALGGPWQPGRHAVSLQPTADAAQSPAVRPLHFLFDDGAPKIQFEVGDATLLERYGLDQDVERKHPPRRTDPERDKRVELIWSPDGRRWLPLLPKDARTDGKGAYADWPTLADRPQVFLWALDEGTFGPGAPLTPDKHAVVRIWASDELSAVKDLRLRVLPATEGHRLEIVATDLVGNTSSVTWPLAE